MAESIAAATGPARTTHLATCMFNCDTGDRPALIDRRDLIIGDGPFFMPPGHGATNYRIAPGAG